MKKVCLVFLYLISLFSLIYSQKKYEANWESLDSRPLPKWFADAKFGVFIHFGPSSVPGWSPKGTYSEWYQYWLQSKSLFGNGDFTGTEVYDYHNKTYGEDVSYYEFGEMFKADLFDANEWASIFEKSGAKYIVITTKHHDGYCLWPSEEANDRGFAWNSFDIGPKKDIIGELTDAVRKTDVKMGFYYSLYEWYHPWWLGDKERFVNEHFHPQFKDLIESYQPDIIWGDGEWDLGSDKWKTPELIKWLYNESSVKDKIIINDRWGKEIRKHHGGYFTTEYEAGATFNRPWEECRGMGFSFGYNQEEDIEDYSTAQTLVLMLCDIVSQGGNLLLDIGPNGRGSIPVIMQERLLQIGQWLDINGEAIYGTSTWKYPVQWTEGKREGHGEEQHYQGSDYILKQTVDVKEGFAAKEILFTYKNENLFAITPNWPGKNLEIKNVSASNDTKVYFLDSGEELKWETKNNNIVIHLPDYNPNLIRTNLAYAFKITEIENYVKNVGIDIHYNGFNSDPKIEMECKTEGSQIFYTLNGAEPSKKSNIYSSPFKINKSATIKARAFKDHHSDGDISTFYANVVSHISNLESNVIPSASYSGKGLFSLVDGVRGSEDYKDQKWIGFEGEDVELNIELPMEKNINEIELGVLEAQKSWIFQPTEIRFFSSSDGENFTEIGMVSNELTKKGDGIEILNITKTFNHVSSKFLKIKINTINECPDWHIGAGGKTWLFLDEVKINGE